MKMICCVIMGYLLGSLSPSALFSKLKKKDLREEGTKNLGAINTTMVLGKGYGVFVMLFDIGKTVVAVTIARILCPGNLLASLLTGGAAVLGHIFPFYLRFKGGKGLAPFGGFVLAMDPLLFVILLVFGVVLMLLVNYSYVLPFSAAILFPILEGLRTQSIEVFVVTAAVSLLIMAKHSGNLVKAKNHEDIRVREYIKEHLFH